jgi:AraC-like DNA-binding protein
VIRVIAHLTANLGEDQTLKDLADVAMLSPFHFNRIFRDVTGVSPVRYLYAMRLSEAERQILSTRLKVIDICYGVGYKSLGSFNNRFVSLIGYSPRQIRNLAAAIDMADLRRLTDARGPSTPDRREPCSMWGAVRVPQGFCGVVIVAIFPGPPSNCYPVATVLAEGDSYALPPISQPGNFSVIAVGLRWHERVADFLLQQDLLRATMPPIFLSADGLSSPIDLHLAPSEPFDPPIPPSLPLRVLAHLVRLPIDSPEQTAEPSQFLFRHPKAPSPLAQPDWGDGEADRPLWLTTGRREPVRRSEPVH